MATMLCVVSRPPFDEIEIASAGHLPPVLAISGCPPASIDLPETLPLGARANAPPSSTTVDLPLGSVCLAYTDGLIERRGESLDVGLQRLVDVAEAAHPEIVCRSVRCTHS
jgi:phosphoserine phosphatase RsbU/P